MRYTAVNSFRRPRRKFLCFSVSNYSSVLTGATNSVLTQVRPFDHTRFLASPWTLNETQKIARLYVSDGVAHGAYTNVGGHNHDSMKIFQTIAIIILILTLGMLGLWRSVLGHMGDILEFDYPSRNIEHSIEKGIFIDTLKIIESDTIRTNRFERIDILPTSSWIEKKTYWKSGTMDLDSLGFVPDIVVLTVNFRNFKNGKSWTPDHGYNIGDFEIGKGNHESVYIDSDITRLRFESRLDDLSDTIRLTTKDREQIVLYKRSR